MSLGAPCRPGRAPASTVFGRRRQNFRREYHFACTTCHALEPTKPGGARLAGYSLAGVAKRRTFYGGAEDQLLDAVNFCIIYYMRGVALRPDDPDGRAIYEFFLSISPGDLVDGLPWTVVHLFPTNTLPGDPARGKQLYDAACLNCHGKLHTGSGRREPKATVLPEEAVDFYNANFPGVNHRTIITETLRGGVFFGLGCQMPPYGAELLSDAEIADLAAYLDLCEPN